MKVHGQSVLRSHVPDQASDRRAKPKPFRQLTISTYNVRTLNDSSFVGRRVAYKLPQIIAGCNTHGIDIMCIQEHRQHTTTELGEQHIDGWTLTHTNSSHTSHGVAVLYSKQIEPFVTSVVYKSGRIIALHLQGNPKVCVICAYAPTNTSAAAAKDAFYSDLADLICTIPPHTILVLAGDFNARLGKDSQETNRRIVGPNCIHDATNDNGQRMIDLCEAHSLRPAHSHFEHPESRLYTYTGLKDEQPATTTAAGTTPEKQKFQIDHIMICMKWWKWIKNCRAYDTIDIGSDHRCVSAKLRLSLRVNKRPPNSRCKFNWSKLADLNTRNTFNLELKNRFEALMEETTSCGDEIQRHTDALDAALRRSSEKVLGKKRKSKYKSWVGEATLRLIQRCHKAKSKYKRTRSPNDELNWHQLQEEVSNMLDADEQARLNAQLDLLKIASDKREYGTTWQIIHQIAGEDPNASPDKVRMLDGSLPSDPTALLNEWRSYFSTLLNNRNANADAATHPTPSADHKSIRTGKITYAEVLDAIKALKRNKSPGPDYSMTAEVLKDGGDFIVNELHKICQLVYDQHRAPKQWTSSMIVPLPKKGNLQLMTNYRGICLMSIAAKAYNRILLNRIRDPIDSVLRTNQAGFRVGRSCIQQINILRRIMEEAERKQRSLFITYVDFKKAFDSIDRSMMFAILRNYGIPEKIVDAIRVLYDDSKCQVFLKGQLSEPFDVTTGVLQGDVLAPFLFIIVIDYVSTQAAGDFGFLTHKGNSVDTSGRQMRTTTRIPDRKINDLAFADDIALLEGSPTRAQEQLDALRCSASKVGLEINIGKTEQMCLVPSSAASQPQTNLTIDGQQIKVVDEFKYLGAYMSSTEKDVKCRIGLAWAAFAKLKPILSSPKPTISFKISLFDAACISILLYGCESWNLTATLTAQLDIFVRKCYRMILGIRQAEDHVTNDELYRRAERGPISELIRHRQLKFLGHCLRMSDDEPANTYALYESNIGTLNVGRPKTTYIQHITQDLQEKQRILRISGGPLTVKTIAEWAKDKAKWNALFVVPRKKRPPDPTSTPRLV